MTMNIKESLVHWLDEIDDQIQIYSAGKPEVVVIHFLLLARLSDNRNGQKFNDHAFAFRFCLAVRRIEESLPAWAPNLSVAWAEASASALRVFLVDRLPTGWQQLRFVWSASPPAFATLAICSQEPQWPC